MHEPLRRSLLAWSLIALVAAACGAGPSITANPTQEPPCGPPLTPVAMDGGFLATELAPPATDMVVQVVLAAGEGGPMLTGRTILFVGSFTGASPVTVKAGAVAAVEAEAPGVDAPHCAGFVRAVVPSDVLGGLGKGAAAVEAKLGNIDVGGASLGCTAIAAGTGTTAVECPSLGIRIGDQASAGTLWLRFRSASSAETVEALPDWVARLMGPTETAPAANSIGGTATVDGQSFAIRPSVSEFDGVVVEPLGVSVGLRATFSIEAAPNEPRLTIAISGYDAPGAYTDGTFVTLGESIPMADGSTNQKTSTAAGCHVEVGADELTGSMACRLTAQAPFTGTVDVAAEWTVATVTRLIGPKVHVDWKIDGAYVSQGQATVTSTLNPGLDPSILRAVEVLVGHPGTHDLLRIDIRGFNGDGTYSGDAVDPSLQDVFEDSPNIQVNVGTPTFDPAMMETRETWTPIFGECTATITDAGASGSVTCTGVPSFEDDHHAGSTTLFATWRRG